MLSDIPFGYVECECMSTKLKNRMRFICPKEIANHPILVKNRKELPALAVKYLECKDAYFINKRITSELFFDVEKEKHLSKMDEILTKQNELKKEINKNISPYEWYITKDSKGSVICLLVKKNEVDE